MPDATVSPQAAYVPVETSTNNVEGALTRSPSPSVVFETFPQQVTCDVMLMPHAEYPAVEICKIVVAGAVKSPVTAVPSHAT
jgi:hypothetical protein